MVKVLVPQVILPIGAVALLVLLYWGNPAFAVVWAFVCGMAAGGQKA